MQIAKLLSYVQPLVSSMKYNIIAFCIITVGYPSVAVRFFIGSNPGKFFHEFIAHCFRNRFSFDSFASFFVLQLNNDTSLILSACHF